MSPDTPQSTPTLTNSARIAAQIANSFASVVSCSITEDPRMRTLLISLFVLALLVSPADAQCHLL